MVNLSAKLTGFSPSTVEACRSRKKGLV